MDRRRIEPADVECIVYHTGGFALLLRAPDREWRVEFDADLWAGTLAEHLGEVVARRAKDLADLRRSLAQAAEGGDGE